MREHSNLYFIFLWDRERNIMQPEKESSLKIFFERYISKLKANTNLPPGNENS